LKALSFFILFIYWSLIILAPVLSNEFKNKKERIVIVPLKKT
tara:strand:+ start:3238 stop:3363 length:126 start_codon:yes stop_codon:yes gene_type:complete